MKLQIKIPVVVCRDGSYNGYGFGDINGLGDVDTSLSYEGFDEIDADLIMVMVTAEVDVDALFAEKTVQGTIERGTN